MVFIYKDQAEYALYDRCVFKRHTKRNFFQFCTWMWVIWAFALLVVGFIDLIWQLLKIWGWGDAFQRGRQVKTLGGLKTEKICSCTDIKWWFCQYLCNRSDFLLRIWAVKDAVILVHSLPMKSRKRLACVIIDTSDTHDITDTDRQTQNGSAHSHVFMTFKHWFLTSQTLDRVKIL